VKKLFIMLGLVGVLVVAGIVVGVGLIIQRQLQPQGVNTVTPTPAATTATTPINIPGNMPHVEGAQIVDSSGNPLILRGAQIQSSLVFINGWKKPEQNLNSTTFHVMVHDWHMNALRLPTSNWIYDKNPTKYMSELDRIIEEANAAGLYVIIDLHDNVKSGSPYAKGDDVPKPQDVEYWKIIAAHFKNNPMVMFDVLNEPQVRGWDAWLHGGGTVGGTPLLGFQDLVDAVRSVGAKQIIVVEPGKAGGDTGESGGWATMGNHFINDPYGNIVYSRHVYSDISLPPAQQDAKWGPLLNHYPIYYGEWAFLPNSLVPVQCRSVSHDEADQVVTNFLHYMESRHASWTAWSFVSPYLIQDTTTYTPTTLDVPWTCGDSSTVAGMGSIIKRYLTTGQ
jgi:aryl-phospho-beta-D-glucosidase BglC (GH1 family)